MLPITSKIPFLVGFSNHHKLVSFKIGELVSDHLWHSFLSHFFLKFLADLLHKRMLSIRWHKTKKVWYQKLHARKRIPWWEYKGAIHTPCVFVRLPFPIVWVSQHVFMLHESYCRNCSFLALFLFFCIWLTQTLVSFCPCPFSSLTNNTNMQNIILQLMYCLLWLVVPLVVFRSF